MYMYVCKGLYRDLPIANVTAECKQIFIQTFNWFFLKYIVNPLTAI